MEKVLKIKDITEEEWLSINIENRKIVDEFLRESTQLSPQTLKQYRSGLKIYFWWLKNNFPDKLFFEIKSRGA